MLEQQVRRRVTEIVAAVVTMNSQVRLWNSDRDDEMVLSLVFPPDARGSDFDKIKLSVLTHTGLSLLGRKVGDTIDGCLKILAMPYQPEAAGDFSL
jgi:transcription elongation GreA/GreB family factor